MANTTGKKYGGRGKGTPNKVTKELREILKEFITKEIENLPSKLKTLDDKERLDIVVKLLPYVLAKLENIPATTQDDTDISPKGFEWPTIEPNPESQNLPD